MRIKHTYILLTLVSLLFLVGCTAQNITFSKSTMVKYNNSGNVEISITPKKLINNNLVFEIRLTTHSGDLTELNWNDLIKVSDGENAFEVIDINFLRKSEHHPILEVTVNITEEVLQNIGKINVKIGPLQGDPVKTFTWKNKDLQNILKPNLGLLGIGNDNSLWLLTEDMQRKIVNYDKPISNATKIANNNWIIRNEEGQPNILQINSVTNTKLKSMPINPYIDMAYFAVEKILLGINDLGNKLSAINLETGETILTYKDIVDNASQIEIVGTKLYAAQNNEIKIIDLKNYVPEKLIALDYGQITQLEKTYDERFLMALTDQDALLVFDMTEMGIVEKFYNIQDYSYDFIKNRFLFVKPDNTKVSSFSLVNKETREIAVDNVLIDIAVIPGTDFAYVMTEKNGLILLNYITREKEILEFNPDIKYLEDNYLQLSS